LTIQNILQLHLKHVLRSLQSYVYTQSTIKAQLTFNQLTAKR